MLRRIGVAAALVAIIGTALPACIAAQDLTIDIQIAPKVLNLSSTGAWVTIHADVPYADVALYGVTINGVEVPVAWDKADLTGDLVIKLRRSEVESVVEPGVVPVVVAGVLSDDSGTTFVGAKNYRVIAEANRYRERRGQ